MQTITEKLIKDLEIQDIASQDIFVVNHSENRVNFEKAVQIAQRVFGKTGEAHISQSNYPGHFTGLCQQVENNLWFT